MTERNAEAASEPWTLRLLAGLVLAAPVLALDKGLAMAPVLALLAGVSLIGSGWDGSRRRIFAAALVRHRRLAIGLLLLLGWSGAACFWSFNPLFSLKSLAMLVGTTLSGAVFLVRLQTLGDKAHSRLDLALAVGLGLAAMPMVGLGLADRAGVPDVGRFLLGMDGAATVLAVLVWPAATGLARLGRRRTAWFLLLVVAMGIFSSHDLAAKVAFMVGGIVGGLSTRPLVKLIVSLAVAGSLLAPLAALHLPPRQESAAWSWLPSSAHHRLTIWTFAATAAVQKPLKGWGFDSARAIPGGKTQVPVVRLKGCKGEGDHVPVPGFTDLVPADCVIWEEQLPLHPHDAWLQVWLELGLPGALITAFLLWEVGRCLWRSRPCEPAAAATLASGLVVCSVSFGVWQSWWLSTLWLAAALLSPTGGAPGQSSERA